MTVYLIHEGYVVNVKRVRRLLRLMGLEALYARPRLSQPGVGHRIYPYLLRGVRIERVDHVWSTDITYIRLAHGFVYLVAVMDWYSRYVLSWEVSISLEGEFCVSALEWALQHRRPEIFNMDQGAQFTSPKFTSRIEAAGALVSMDGRGRALDNVFVERLWRTVKEEEVYLRNYESAEDAKRQLGRYFQFYNNERWHSSLSYQTPAEVYWAAKAGSKGGGLRPLHPPDLSPCGRPRVARS